MKMKMKKGSHRYDSNRLIQTIDKYTKEKMCLSIMMLVCIKQHLKNI